MKGRENMQADKASLVYISSLAASSINKQKQTYRAIQYHLTYAAHHSTCTPPPITSHTHTYQKTLPPFECNTAAPTKQGKLVRHQKPAAARKQKRHPTKRNAAVPAHTVQANGQSRRASRSNRRLQVIMREREVCGV
jgi:hypothetical protein